MKQDCKGVSVGSCGSTRRSAYHRVLDHFQSSTLRQTPRCISSRRTARQASS